MSSILGNKRSRSNRAGSKLHVLLTRPLRYTWIPCLYIIAEACIEPYEFLIRSPQDHLVIEASLSNRSFKETLEYPSDGRFFTAKLSLTGNVTNSRPVPVSGAAVELWTNDGQVMAYTPTASGIYTLTDSTFKAEKGVGYKIRVSLPDETVYESSWESMPEATIPEMGSIGYTEQEKQMYIREGTEWMVREKQLITTHIDVPSNERDEIFYRWNFTPMWIFRAPLIPPSDPVGTCWATDKNYLNTYVLQADRTGGYRKELFDLPTIRNPRIYYKMSVLVTQQAMRQPYFAFWKEMKDRNERSSLQDLPPYNLETNFTCVTGDEPVSGYFGVTEEQARRWYFVKEELSYAVQNTAVADCLGFDEIADECENCLFYSFGEVTNVKPRWWEGN